MKLSHESPDQVWVISTGNPDLSHDVFIHWEVLDILAGNIFSSAFDTPHPA